MKITNTQLGPRGINTVNGPVLIEPGQTVDVEVFEREKEHLEAASWFTIEGEFTADDGKQGVRVSTDQMDQLKTKFEEQETEIGRLTSENSDLNAKLTKSDEDIVNLESKVAELQKALEAASAPKADAPATAFQVKETSPGWFAAFDADGKQVGAKMREADANAFKAMTPEEQKAYLAD